MHIQYGWCACQCRHTHHVAALCHGGETYLFSPRRVEGLPPDVHVAESVTRAVALLSEPPLSASVERVFVIGGAAAFQEVLTGGSDVPCDTVYLTRVFQDIPCDVFIPAIDDNKFALADMKVC